MLGAMARALGFDLRRRATPSSGSSTSGSPDPPQELVDRGFGVVHSVKNDPAMDEASLRAWFAERRAS